MPDLSTLRIEHGPPAPVAPASVDTAERELGTRFPAGYRDYVTRFGAGVLGGYVRVYVPDRILRGPDGLADWRERVAEHWFWDANPHISRQTSGSHVILADTLDGDELCFHPDAPDRILVLPRESETVHVVEGGLLPALDWLLLSDELVDPVHDAAFRPDTLAAA